MNTVRENYQTKKNKTGSLGKRTEPDANYSHK